MSELTDSIAALNKAATDAEDTTVFFNQVTTLGPTSTVTNIFNNVTVPSVQKQIKDLYDLDGNSLATYATSAEDSAVRAEAAAAGIDENLIVATGTTIGRTLPDRFADSINIKDEGATILALDNAIAIQNIIDLNPRHIIIDDTYLTGALVWDNFTGKVSGGGKLVGIQSTNPNKVFMSFSGASGIRWDDVDLDLSQTTDTVTADNKWRYGFFISNCTNLRFKDSTVSGIKIGYPMYITGTSYNGIDTTAYGSKNIRFTRCDVDAFPDPQADNGAQVIIRSDYYASTTSGTHVSGSNAMLASDYTVDPSVTYPATTEDIRFTDCNIDSCDRLGVLNAKKVYLNNNVLTNMNKRGISCSPTCDNVHISGGSIEGGISATINFTLGTTNSSASNVRVTPISYDSLVGEATALRVLQGCSDITFSNITGNAGRLRGVWVLGSSDITLDNVTLSEYPEGTTYGVDVTAGLGGNTVAYTADNITIKNSKFTAETAIGFNTTTGISDYADGAIAFKNNIFKCDTASVSSPFVSSPAIQNKIDLLDNEFYGSGANIETNFRGAVYCRNSLRNTYNYGGTSTEGFATRAYDSTSLPDDAPTGTSLIICDGTDDDLPGTTKQGVLRTVRPYGLGSTRAHRYQTYVSYNHDNGSEVSRMYFRKALSASNGWAGWQTLAGTTIQSWKDVTSLRSYEVNYTNTTNQPIHVSVAVTLTSDTLGDALRVDNIVVSKALKGDASTGIFMLTAKVPAGSSYKITGYGTISSWAELS